MFENYKYPSTRNAMQAVHDFQRVRASLREAIAEDAKKYNEKEQARRREGYANAFNESLQKVSEALKAMEADISTRRAARINNALSIGTAAADFQLLSLPVTLSVEDLRVLLARNAETPLFCRAVAEYAKGKGYTEAKDLLAAGENIHATSRGGEEICTWLHKVTETPDSRLASAATIKGYLEGRGCNRNANVQNDLFYALHENGTFAGMEA